MIHILCLSPSPMPSSCSADRPGPYISGHIINELLNCLRLEVTHYVPSHDNANHQPTSIRLQWTRIQRKKEPQSPEPTVGTDHLKDPTAKTRTTHAVDRAIVVLQNYPNQHWQ